MGVASKYGRMDRDTMASGKMVLLADLAGWFMLRATSMLELGRMIRRTAMVPTVTTMVVGTRVSGSQINSTERELKNGLMVQSMQVSTWKEKSTELASLSGLIKAPTPVISTTTTYMGAASTTGRMGACLQATGSTTEWKAWAFLPGAMAGST